MSKKTTTTIEIKGVKFDIDLRSAQAVRIDELRVGSRVKVLLKGYSGYVVHHGVIVSFDNFKNLPTINVAYVEHDYGSAGLKFIGFNSETKDTEIVAAMDEDHPVLESTVIIAQFNKMIAAKQKEVHDLEAKRDYFEGHFREWWQVEKPADPSLEPELL